MDIWGPHYWFVLHTIAFNYPKHPTAIQKKVHYRLIHNLHEFLPDPAKGLYVRVLNRHPVLPSLDRREDFVKWMNDLHNMINRSTKKPVFTLAEHYEWYKEATTPRLSVLQQFLKSRRLLLYGVFVFMLGLVAYMYSS